MTAAVTARPFSGPPKQAEAEERKVIGGRNEPGKLASVIPGDPKKGMVLTVHGANGSPQTMDAFHQDRYARGRAVQTFAHDDMYRNLQKSSGDLAGELRTWMQANPGAPLEIDAHCQGARITVGALDTLAKEKALDGRAVKLNLITPPLQGLKRGALAALPGSGLIGGAVPTVRAGKDMAPYFDFQKTMEGVSLPPNVKTTVFVADRLARDGFVDPEHVRFQRVTRRLNADVIELPRTDHMTAVPAAARRLR